MQAVRPVSWLINLVLQPEENQAANVYLLLGNSLSMICIKIKPKFKARRWHANPILPKNDSVKVVELYSVWNVKLSTRYLLQWKTFLNFSTSKLLSCIQVYWVWHFQIISFACLIYFLSLTFFSRAEGLRNVSCECLCISSFYSLKYKLFPNITILQWKMPCSNLHHNQFLQSNLIMTFNPCNPISWGWKSFIQLFIISCVVKN